MIRACAVAAILVTFVIPTPAHANWYKALAWLEELSGPGPFKGHLLTGEVACSGELLPSLIPTYVADVKGLASRSPTDDQWEELVKKIDDERRCRYDRRNVRYAVVLEMGWWNDKPNADFAGDIDLLALQSVVYVPLRPWSRNSDNRLLRSVEIGAGLGAYKMTGPGVQGEERDFWRGSVPVRLRVFPSELLIQEGWLNARSLQTRRLLQSIQFRTGIDWLPGILSPEEFVLTPDSRARRTTNDVVRTWAITVDLGAIVWASQVPRHTKYAPPSAAPTP